uniref:Uncharacterized protein n=1 Tax=Zea mays TaxID=4577 RepID=A0A804U754_MAIZE
MDCLAERGLVWGMEDSSMKLRKVPTWERALRSADPSRDHERDKDESGGDDDDDECAVLIRQIVERTKQGSHVLVNAQKLLFSVDQ